MPETRMNFMERHRIPIILGMIIAITVTGLLFSIWFPAKPGPEQTDHLVIGAPFAEQDALIWLAADKGFFVKNGLNVTVLDDYPTGVGPVDDMASGKNELAFSAEYPVLTKIFTGGNISIVATIDRFQNEYLVSRQDTGIRNISDLKGRKIGFPKGTILEFYLGRLLAGNGLSPSMVLLTDVNTTHAGDAIANGEVDALMTFQPHTAGVLMKLGQNATLWPGQGGQLVYGVVSARKDWIAANPGKIRKFLKALNEAEQYAASNPGEMKSVVLSHMNVTGEYADSVLPDHQFGLTLDRSLLTAMNDEARWMIANNRTGETTVPDFRDYIDTTALLEVKPGVVNIR